MGIKQLSYFVRFFGGLVAVIVGIVHERKISLFTDIPKLFRILTIVKPTFTNFSQVWEEFRDLDESEKRELEVILSIELDADIELPEQLELVKRAMSAALGLLEAITLFKKNAVRE